MDLIRLRWSADEDLSTTTVVLCQCERNVHNCVNGQHVQCEAGQPGTEVCGL
jgi:hypothetical protein